VKEGFIALINMSTKVVQILRWDFVFKEKIVSLDTSFINFAGTTCMATVKKEPGVQTSIPKYLLKKISKVPKNYFNSFRKPNPNTTSATTVLK